MAHNWPTSWLMWSIRWWIWLAKWFILYESYTMNCRLSSELIVRILNLCEVASLISVFLENSRRKRCRYFALNTKNLYSGRSKFFVLNFLAWVFKTNKIVQVFLYFLACALFKINQSANKKYFIYCRIRMFW